MTLFYIRLLLEFVRCPNRRYWPALLPLRSPCLRTRDQYLKALRSDFPRLESLLIETKVLERQVVGEQPSLYCKFQ